MRDLIMTILTAGLQLVILVTLGYVINFLYSKIGTEKTKRYFEIAKMIVRGVEQEFGAGNGADKKAEAVNLIKKIIGNKLTDEEIDKLIEAAVFEMNYVLNIKGLNSMSKKL
ncbi:phage holin [Thermoanaerobacterium sp. CMT5567-10]|uniref:phage holin n=1 Tax=Thermoanaerobacterium sp. CMT5567-10 TaxID=3061989 RepID=UPI0026E051B9|nr:phage holin [Thermoanaerobacterium sp. CMT5567-10]WKV07867.1 phage holin [Thermoanaerobacterium sp. CMT5567-10]